MLERNYLFTLDEIKEAVEPNKVSESDEVPPESIKEVVKAAPEQILAMFNGMLERQTFILEDSKTDSSRCQHRI